MRKSHENLPTFENQLEERFTTNKINNQANKTNLDNKLH